MRLYNSLTRQKEEFKPLKKNAVGMYVCGPTVYDVGHLGHARSAVAFDVIHRYLKYKGFAVTFVSNITDVDDKIIARAAREGKTEMQLVEEIIPEYAKDYGALGVLPPTHQPRCTQYIPQMVTLIEKLIATDHAYVTDDGIYFKVSSLPEYGQLSNQKVEELQSGSRIEVDEKKQSPLDFAVWKKMKPGETTASWDGPRGMKGRPGWHIECSAMSSSIFGDTFDIHGGGIDLIFPHHEDEVAQSLAALSPETLTHLEKDGRRGFAQYWLHNGHVRVDNTKMSKSLGNFFTIKEMLAKWHPAVLRYFLLSTHYRLPIDFSDALLEQAQNSVEKIRNFTDRLSAAVPTQHDDAQFGDFTEKLERDFEAAMDDDFQISNALPALFQLITQGNAAMDDGTLSIEGKARLTATLQKLDAVLALTEILSSKGSDDAEIEKLIAERASAKKAKDFARSDAIRTELNTKGIIIEDTPQGTIWKRKL